MEVLHREMGDSKYRPSILLARMVDAGYLGMLLLDPPAGFGPDLGCRTGKKVGKGFYEY
jgi:3-hydroxybutyryl-CoA dehydrogenase